MENDFLSPKATPYLLVRINVKLLLTLAHPVPHAIDVETKLNFRFFFRERNYLLLFSFRYSSHFPGKSYEGSGIERSRSYSTWLHAFYKMRIWSKVGYSFCSYQNVLTLKTPALESLCGGQLSSSTQLIKPSDLVILRTDASPQFF